MKRTLRRVQPIRRTAAMVIGDGLLLALMLAGLFLFQYNVYGLPGSPVVVLRACLVSAVVFLAVFSLPKYRWAVVLCLAVLGLILLWRSWDVVLQGAQAVYHTIAHMITESTDFPGEFPIPTQWTQEEIQTASNCFLSAVIFTLALPLGWAVVRRRAFLPVLLLTLPWLIPIFLAEFPPDVISLSMLAAGWMTLLLTGLTARRDPKGGARLTLLALPTALLALCCVCLLFPVEGYTYPDWAANTAQRLTELGENIQIGLGNDGVPATVDLAHAGPRQFTGKSVLKVESNWSGRIYLRGATYANYTGDGWERLSDEAQAALESIAPEDSLIFPLEDRTADPISSFTITHLNGATRMAYYLYQSVNLSETLGEVSYVADSYLRLAEPTREYTIETEAFDYSGTAVDEAYSRFVYEHYLDVPEELADTLWDLDYWISREGPLGVAQAVAHMLEQSTEYDLQTPVTPDGEDFVAYFLTKSHRGYCVHYASAAVLLLRAAGIPARYVSGYTVEIADGEALVPDSAAHAWVEIYLDGYGWYPVEVTPAAAFGDGTAGEESPAVSDTAEPTPSAEPAQSPAPSAPPAAEPAEKPSQTPSGMPGTGTQKGGGAPLDLSWLCYGAAVLVILGAPVLYRTLRRRRWNRLTNLADNNQAVLEVYCWYRKLFSWGGKPDEQLENLARKAKFSQHTLTLEERRQAFAILCREIARLSVQQPFWKRPFFRYWFLWK